MTRLNRYFPKLCHPTCGLEINYQRINKLGSRLKVMTLSEVVAIAGKRGAFKVTIALEPRHVNERCTACGDCAKAVKTEIPNPFNYGLDKIKERIAVNAND